MRSSRVGAALALAALVADTRTGRRRGGEAALLALRRPQLPDAAVLRRHASAHLVLDGRRRVRRAADAARRLPFRQGRGGHASTRPAGQAVAPARLPRRRRPLGRHGLLPAADERRSRASGRPAGPQVVRHDHGRARAPRRRSTSSSSFGKGKIPKAILPVPGTPAYRKRLAGDDRGGGGGQRARAASPPSSATSGRRTPAATTCTATSSSATTARRRARSSRTPRCKPLGSDNPRDLWKWMAAVRGEDRRQRARHRPQRQPEQRPHVPAGRGVRQAARPRRTPRARAKWERLYEVTQTKGTAKRIRSCRPTTSSPTSRSGTRATSTAACRRRRTCSSSSTRARR